MRCSIIVRCYNEARYIERLLCGISQQSQRDLEVIAVDSGSTDGTLNILKRSDVKILSLAPSEFSFGRSCNLGCEAAQGDYVVFISAHAYPVYSTWLEEILKPFADPGVAVSYGKQRGNRLNTYSEQQIFKSWYPDDHIGIPPKNHPFCNNANCAVRRSVWEEIRYDESLTGLEDIDFANRAIRLGYKVIYAPSAEIVHVHEEHPIAVFRRYLREAIAYRTIFPKEKLSLFDFIKLYSLNATSDCYHAWHDGIFREHAASILQFRLMQFWGTYRGMRQKDHVSHSLKERLYYPGSQNSKQNDTDGEGQLCVINYDQTAPNKDNTA
jgi:rhamnosyltransferase